ncbi:bilin-binding protein-like [Papilio machaon]|uniref:bilin-binding protein-like n=1 Tax=Papilio machaon TaxID=76193 RepID=UPI001E662B3A|nr:bilin-binding protein-like [Papilio machaon]
MHCYILFALIAVVSASSNVIYEGPCPHVKPQQNFDFASYQGTWYEIARYPNAGEEGARGKCTIAEYLIHGYGTGRVKNSHVIDGVRSFIEGDLTLVGPARIRLTYTFDGLSKDSYLTVLDTDYTNYAIGYSCKYFPDGNNHQVFSWIKSRSPTMDAYSRIIVENYLKKSTILDINKYVANDFSSAACQAYIFRSITEFLKH